MLSGNQEVTRQCYRFKAVYDLAPIKGLLYQGHSVNDMFACLGIYLHAFMHYASKYTHSDSKQMFCKQGQKLKQRYDQPTYLKRI